MPFEEIEQSCINALKNIDQSGESDKFKLWQAYVAIEYAIMCLRLDNGYFESTSSRKYITKEKLDIETVLKQTLSSIRGDDVNNTLDNLRKCRNILKRKISRL